MVLILRIKMKSSEMTGLHIMSEMPSSGGVRRGFRACDLVIFPFQVGCYINKIAEALPMPNPLIRDIDWSHGKSGAEILSIVINTMPLLNNKRKDSESVFLVVTKAPASRIVPGIR
jgi:hypothetical protein